MTTTIDRILPMLINWVGRGERRSFAIEYGYGISEEPYIVLSVSGKPVWEGIFIDFLKFINE